MVGIQMNYDLIYSENFVLNLEKLIYHWESELGFSNEEISKFVTSIGASLKLLRKFPEMHEEVSKIYHFAIPTYRILIGKQYAIFYRVDHKTKQVHIGSLFSQKQMRVHF